MGHGRHLVRWYDQTLPRPESSLQLCFRSLIGVVYFLSTYIQIWLQVWCSGISTVQELQFCLDSVSPIMVWLSDQKVRVLYAPAWPRPAKDGLPELSAFRLWFSPCCSRPVSLLLSPLPAGSWVL